jgi:hypothetical protein
MSLVDSPKPDYLQAGGPSEKKAPWVRRHFWKVTLALLNLGVAAVIIATVVTRPDLFRAYGGVSGQVVDAQGSPVTDAQIFVSSAERWLAVDSVGRFTLDRVPVGPTLVLVVHSPQGTSAGAPPISQAVIIVRGRTVDVGTLLIGKGS